MEIVRPKQAQLRTAWPREDTDFTPWLAENLDYLDDIGLGDLELVGRELSVPGVGRRLDILAETLDERRVAIENQYRSLDHDHLTRGLAYAAGLEAHALVVIAEDHRDEFTAVADYLNHCAESLDGPGIAVFLVTVRLEAVGDFLLPRFETRSRPNAWRAEIQQGTPHHQLQQSTESRKERRRHFWEEFIAAAQRLGIDPWRHAQPRTASYLSTSAIPGVDVSWTMRVRAGDCYPMLWIDVGDPARNAAMLYEIRERLGDCELDIELEWDAKDGARACSINAEPITDCGWTTASSERASSIETAVTRYAAFHAALEPLVSTCGVHVEDQG